MRIALFVVGQHRALRSGSRDGRPVHWAQKLSTFCCCEDPHPRDVCVISVDGMNDIIILYRRLGGYVSVSVEYAFCFRKHVIMKGCNASIHHFCLKFIIIITALPHSIQNVAPVVLSTDTHPQYPRHVPRHI